MWRTDDIKWPDSLFVVGELRIRSYMQPLRPDSDLNG